MRALSSLIVLNSPDLVLFVGEALVGNDAVDQLTKFAQRLKDLATGSNPHSIDGILLTKFDTIDDKVCLPGDQRKAAWIGLELLDMLCTMLCRTMWRAAYLQHCSLRGPNTGAACSMHILGGSAMCKN